MSALEVDTVDDTDEPRDSFHVHDTASAEWAMRRVAKLRSDLAEHEAYAEQVASWLKAEREREASAESWLVEQLEGYHRRLFDEDDRRKTITLPSGELKARKHPDGITFADEGEFCAAYADTDLVRTVMSPDKAKVRQEVLKRGATFDGVEVVPGDVKFSVVVAVPTFTEEEPF